MEVRFIELPNGRFINVAAIRDFNPHYQRINYLDSAWERITEPEVEVVIAALRPKQSEPKDQAPPKRRGRPPKADKATT